MASKQLNGVRNLMADGVDRFAEWQPHTVYGKPTFFRGDAWQLLLAQPRWALRISLLIRAILRAESNVDTRIAIAIGGADEIVPDDISLSTGEAFTLSGRALDKITGYFELTGAIPDRAGVMATWLPVILHLCSGLARSWTSRQAEIVSHALLLENFTHESIAKLLDPPVSKQTVTGALTGANWRTLVEPIRAFEAADWASIIGSDGINNITRQPK
ncbi:MAG TPA: hypothetical protein VHY79_15700 [Rhizomicrobium sp.]|jgi:hypothetical protein|nr:hypothetical protein [Rhizomicrobium sp.]